MRAVTGMAFGAIAGMVAGIAAALVLASAVGPAAIVCVSVVLNADQRSQNPGLQAATAMIMVAAVLAYAGIGYGAGVFFRKAAMSAVARNEPVYSPPPSYVG